MSAPGTGSHTGITTPADCSDNAKCANPVKLKAQHCASTPADRHESVRKTGTSYQPPPEHAPTRARPHASPPLETNLTPRVTIPRETP